MAEKQVKKAVIITGGKQYLVAEGQELEVELLASDKKPVFEPIMVISGSDVTVGTPAVSGAQVKADLVEAEVKQDKVTAIRYKSKKRVNKRRGHRQKLSRIKVTAISAK